MELLPTIHIHVGPVITTNSPCYHALCAICRCHLKISFVLYHCHFSLSLSTDIALIDIGLFVDVGGGGEQD